MALKDIFKISRRTFFNPAGWIGYESVRGTTVSIWDNIRSLFFPAGPERTETFEESVQRQALTEDDLRITQSRYLLFAYLFLSLGLLAFIFSFYYLVHFKTFAGFLLAIATAALFLSQAIRYHFWFFQIKNRKLGCTFQEWWQGKVSQSGNTNP